MSNATWKTHERIVAKYFGVERNKRGSDFSISDCDIVASVEQWKATAGCMIKSTPYQGVVVECKHGYSDVPFNLFKDIQRACPTNKIPVGIWGDVGLSWLWDRKKGRAFDKVWWSIVSPDNVSLYNVYKMFHIQPITRKLPGYMIENFEQADGYIAKLDPMLGTYAPLVALHARGMQGRLIAWKL